MIGASLFSSQYLNQTPKDWFNYHMARQEYNKAGRVLIKEPKLAFKVSKEKLETLVKELKMDLDEK